MYEGGERRERSLYVCVCEDVAEGGCKTLTRVIQIKLEAYEKCALFRTQMHMDRPHRRSVRGKETQLKPHEKKIETTFHFCNPGHPPL